MAVYRGSTINLLGIAETVAGTTPATPNMKELPLVSFNPRQSKNVIRSNAIRSHPFVDKILNGANMWELGINWELGRDHDLLIETFLGASFSTDTAKFTDALKTLSLEKQQGGGSSLFDHYLGAFLTSLSISVSGSDTAPVAMTASGRAFSGSWDDPATIATSTTSAGNNDPFTFIGATVEFDDVATKVVSATINLERAVDPLMELGDDDPSEYVPGLCTATGTTTIAYRDGNQSARIEGFTNVKQEYNFGSADGVYGRSWAFPETKFVGFGRSTEDRGVVVQEINWEAQYNVADGTVMSVTRDETP